MIKEHSPDISISILLQPSFSDRSVIVSDPSALTHVIMDNPNSPPPNKIGIRPIKKRSRRNSSPDSSSTPSNPSNPDSASNPSNPSNPSSFMTSALWASIMGKLNSPNNP